MPMLSSVYGRLRSLSSGQAVSLAGQGRHSRVSRRVAAAPARREMPDLQDGQRRSLSRPRDFPPSPQTQGKQCGPVQKEVEAVPAIVPSGRRRVASHQSIDPVVDRSRIARRFSSNQATSLEGGRLSTAGRVIDRTGRGRSRRFLEQQQSEEPACGESQQQPPRESQQQYRFSVRGGPAALPMVESRASGRSPGFYGTRERA